jgi:hypothetical protein
MFSGLMSRCTTPFACEPRPERIAGHERHHVGEQSVELTRCQDRHDVRMLQPRDELHLAPEPIAARRLGRLDAEDLHDHASIER